MQYATWQKGRKGRSKQSQNNQQWLNFLPKFKKLCMAVPWKTQTAVYLFLSTKGNFSKVINDSRKSQWFHGAVQNQWIMTHI